MAASLFEGIPDNTITRTINLATGDRVLIGEFETSGTHLGTYHGFPATGRTITWTFTSVYEFDEAGLLKRQGYYYDTAGLAAQLSGDAVAPA
jgi:predicted ester cyclase